jgi:hypothetical protein
MRKKSAQYKNFDNKLILKPACWLGPIENQRQSDTIWHLRFNY